VWRDRLVEDTIRSNEISDWIDSFHSKVHNHVWLVSTYETRSRWFGSKLIACCGVPTLGVIYRERGVLGETRSQRLALAFHELARSGGTFGEMADFGRLVRDDPDSLVAESE
jgi:hypothetical protein